MYGAQELDEGGGRLGDRKMEVRNRNQSTPVVPRV